MSYFDKCIYYCIANNNNLLLNIIKDNCTISGPGEDSYLFDFLHWLYNNLGYFNIAREDYLKQKKFIKFLIKVYNNEL